MTAQQFIISQLGINGDVKIFQLDNNLDNTLHLMKEFAKLHVEEALKAVIKKGEITHDGFDYVVDKKSILNAYPLINIK